MNLQAAFQGITKIRILGDQNVVQHPALSGQPIYLSGHFPSPDISFLQVCQPLPLCAEQSASRLDPR